MGHLQRFAAPVGVLDVEFLVAVAVARENDLASSRREDRVAVVSRTGDDGDIVRAIGVDLVDVGVVGVVGPALARSLGAFVDDLIAVGRPVWPVDADPRGVILLESSRIFAFDRPESVITCISLAPLYSHEKAILLLTGDHTGCTNVGFTSEELPARALVMRVGLEPSGFMVQMFLPLSNMIFLAPGEYAGLPP